MTQEQALQELTHLMRLQVNLQVTLQLVDDFSYHANFKREMKRFTNNYYNFIERKVEAMTRSMDLQEGEQYVQLVHENYEKIKEIKVTKDETK